MEQGKEDDDWAERYRPSTLSDMEGNGDKIRRVRIWLEGWESGKTPKKRVYFSLAPGSGENYAGTCDSKREGLVDCRIECLRTEECGRHRSSATRGSQYVSLENFSRDPKLLEKL